jgi:hypothetical protein
MDSSTKLNIKCLNIKERSTFKKNKDPRYKKVIKHVQNMNSIVIHDIAISGEAIRGIYSVSAELTFLRLCIENDLYHPHLYRWCVGVSVGAAIITVILNTRYLYECHSKKIALEYLNAVELFFNFNNIRSVFYDIGQNKILGDFAPTLLFKNLFYDGAFCIRQALIEFLEGNHRNLKFNNKKQYFTSKMYETWLTSNNNLDNVFFVCYAQDKSKMIVFTGNEKRFLHASFISYKKLTPRNLIQAVVASSAITLLYPLPEIDDKGALLIDGAFAEISQVVHLQILINIALIIPDNINYTDIFLFFEITPSYNNDFLIIVNKRNIQYLYSQLQEFKKYSIPLINSITSLLSRNSRLRYNSKTNVPLSALFLTQPFVNEFSINELTKNIDSGFKEKNNILKKNLPLIQNSRKKYTRIPVIRLTKEQFNSNNDIFAVQNDFKSYNDFIKLYKKYHTVTSNTVTSSFLYDNTSSVINLLDSKYEEQLDQYGSKIKLSLNVCYLDMYIRCPYQTSDNFELDMLFNKDRDTLSSLKGCGFISGNSVFDIHIQQSLYTVNKENVKDESLKVFANVIQPVITDSIVRFLGPNYGVNTTPN